MKHFEKLSIESDLVKILKQRHKELQASVNEANDRVKSAPDGTLRIKQGKYFCMIKGKGLHYIPKKECEMIKRLAQKEYDLKLVKRHTLEMKIVNTLLSFIERYPVSALFSRLKPERQHLVEPVFITSAEWKSVRYKHKEFKKGDSVLKTPGGIRMRSKSELLIAGLLEEAGIAYRYEYPFEVKTGKMQKCFHPDFYCFDPESHREFVWEHFGLMDDTSYRLSAEEKLMIYTFSGVFNDKNLVVTFEEKEHPFNPDEIQKKLMSFLQKLRE